MEPILGALVEQLHNATRALQFEDMSSQNIRHTIARLEELIPLINSMAVAGDNFSQLNKALLQYQTADLR